VNAEEFSRRWTPRAIKAACGTLHGRYKRELEGGYRAYFSSNPELAAPDHDRKAADLTAALPPGWSSLHDLIPPGQLHQHHLSGGSSQILATALLGSAQAVDGSLSWLAGLLELEASFGFRAPTTTFERRLDGATLSEEPRQTDVDLLVDDPEFLVCIEAKLWEAGLGTCSCGEDESDVRSHREDENESHPTPAQERGACSERVRKRHLYYEAAQQVLGLPELEEGRPCPIAAPYQAVRNIAAARALADARKPVFALFFDARNPYFAECGEWPGWPRALTELARRQGTCAVRSCSWQTLLGSGAVPADVVAWAADKHGLVPSDTAK
jgi:hypothetical protein